MEKVLVKQKSFKQILKYCLQLLLLFCAFFVCDSATVNMGYIAPFCFGLYYAMVFKQKNIYVLSLVFFVSFCLKFLSLESVWIALNLVGVAILMKNFHILIKREAHCLLVMLYALFGNITLIVFNSYSSQVLIANLISILIGEIFLFCCLSLFKIKNRNIKAKFSADEIMCVAVVVSTFGMGLASLNFYGIELLKIFGVMLVLVFSYITNLKISLTCFCVVGLGASVYYSNLAYTAVFVLFTLLAYGFKSTYKILPCVAILLGETIFGLYFGCYQHFSALSLVSVVVGEILFMFVPTKVLNKVGDKLNDIAETVAVRSIINRSRESLTKRMLEVSNVFLEMDTVYKQMVQGALPENEAKAMVKTELFEKCCSDCANKHKCMKLNGKFSSEVFDELINIGFNKGKLTLLDLPQYLTSNCNRINYVVSTLNALLKSYKHYTLMVNNMDSSKILIADQLKGVSDLLKTLAQEVNLNISYDVSMENRIKEELAYKNLCCLEALVYQQTEENKFVTLIMAEKEVQKPVIEKVVSKILGVKMYVSDILTSSVAGAKEVVLKTKAQFDVVFGSANCTKTGKEISGDTHSLIKIDDGKYMIALCDGMGSGEKAHKVSDLTLTLIENFYKAGFDNDIILNSVNKLLSINSDESFSALDICVVDLKKENIDFIKLGSPFGFIKHKTETETITSSGLPIGVLEEMKPHITKKMFSNFDIIVLVSDGVNDAFGGGENLKNYINDLQDINPQTLADKVLQKAKDLVANNCEDDFTVLAVRIYESV